MSNLAVIFERVGGVPVVPNVKPLASLPGHVKVRLTYLTDEPKHYRSYQLLIMYGLRGPFTEEVCALIPVKTLKSLELTEFLPVLAQLQRYNVVGRTVRLSKVAILDEDDSTLAYVC